MCGNQCIELGPPPNSILSMPPPPLPSFLVPRTAIIALAQNDSQPCYAAFVCEALPGIRDPSGIEFIELPGAGFDDAWLFLLVAAVVSIIVVVTVLSFMVMKCREYVPNHFKIANHRLGIFFNFFYIIFRRESVQKRGPVNGIDEPHVSADKSQTFLPGDMMYPCTSNDPSLQQQQMVKENRLLWAALTPHGTRHFVSSAERFPNYDDHYEVVDYQGNRVMRPREGGTLKINPNRSFDNSGFTDLDYEEMSAAMNRTDSFIHDDRDSGYQEPHEVISTLNRNSPRPIVSTPTRIEHPNLPPLNMHPHPYSHSHRGHCSGSTLTPQKRSTLGRRTSETMNMYGSANIWIRIHKLQTGDILSSSM